MDQPIKVLLVDDHDLAREGLRRVLDIEPDIQVVGEATDGEQVAGMVQSLSPDVVLMDIKMPSINGIEATRQLKGSRLNVKVIVLSFIDEYLPQAIEAGAEGYLTKDVKRDELVGAIHRVHRGELVLGGSLMTNPKVGENIVKRLQEVTMGPVGNGIETVHGMAESGNITDVQRALGIRSTAVGKAPRSESIDWHNRTNDATTTILISDVQGSTTLTERLGDNQAHEIMQVHNALVREQVSSYGGFEVKSMGDSFMLAFFSARRAVQCAIDIQRAFSAHNDTHPEEPILVRIGLHTGETIREADDFYGKNVILAYRIADQAKGGQILVSSLLRELTQSAGDIRFGRAVHVELKGLKGSHEIYQVNWQ